MPTVGQMTKNNSVWAGTNPGSYGSVPGPGNIASPAANGVNTGPVTNAPTVSWIALLVTFVLIRIVYEQGARLD